MMGSLESPAKGDLYRVPNEKPTMNINPIGSKYKYKIN